MAEEAERMAEHQPSDEQDLCDQPRYGDEMLVALSQSAEVTTESVLVNGRFSSDDDSRSSVVALLTWVA